MRPSNAALGRAAGHRDDELLADKLGEGRSGGRRGGRATRRRATGCGARRRRSGRSTGSLSLAEALEGVAVPLADPEVALARDTDDAGDAAPSAWTADWVADEEAVPDDAGGEAGAPQAVAIRTAVTVVASSAERERSGFIGTMASFRCGPASPAPLHGGTVASAGDKGAALIFLPSLRTNSTVTGGTGALPQ